jgi:hypothetical protein
VRLLTSRDGVGVGGGDQQPEVIRLAVALDQLAAEIGADRSHDLLHAIELGGGEHRMPVLCVEHQVGVDRKDASGDLDGWSHLVA